MLSLSQICAESIQAAEIKGIAGGGLDIGGDTLVTAILADGSTTDIKANEGIVLNAGVVVINDQYETQATIGYKFGGSSRKNGSITWNTVPMELIQFLRASNMRIGLGLIYQFDPKLVIDIPGTSQTYHFNNAFGTLIQLGWAPVDMPFSIDFRYTSIKYKPSNFSSTEDSNGNSAGLFASFFF